ncbi:3,4-dihydroxy-2-butanone-4-phosphate synthase [Sciscionella marina]|uniref:3,4-dihydroxy-2-butanone-4-phosphate synthase n=1 Tax=Sciscionella marina TaxID=508770 RepID=UPI00038081A8|nr:3,4-dihydroxy-2-butanone-4-phosphate synthase [Sciscionella marina]
MTATRFRESRSLRSAVADLRDGRPVIVADDCLAGGTYDVVLPAALCDRKWTAWIVRHSSGLLCAPLTADRADALGLPPMVWCGADRRHATYTVSVDAARGITTGISAADRSRAAQVLADPGAMSEDLTRPGHLLPLRVVPGGVLEFPGQAEAAVDLCRLARLPPVALAARLVVDTGELAEADDSAVLAHETGLRVVHLTDIISHRLYYGDGERGRVSRVATSHVATRHGELQSVSYRDEVTGAHHLCLIGESSDASPTVSVHAECVSGQVLGDTSCGCGSHLEAAVEDVARSGGALVYLRQAAGRDTANDRTESDAGATGAILVELGYSAVRLAPCGFSPSDVERHDLIVLPALSPFGVAAPFHTQPSP